MDKSATVIQPGPQHTPHREILQPDEYRALCRLRQLKAQGVDLAIVIFKERQMKVRRIEE